MSKDHTSTTVVNDNCSRHQQQQSWNGNEQHYINYYEKNSKQPCHRGRYDSMSSDNFRRYNDKNNKLRSPSPMSDEDELNVNNNNNDNDDWYNTDAFVDIDLGGGGTTTDNIITTTNNVNGFIKSIL